MTFSIPSYYVWMVFILPYVGALATAALRKVDRVRDYVAVAFASSTIGNRTRA